MKTIQKKPANSPSVPITSGKDVQPVPTEQVEIPPAQSRMRRGHRSRRLHRISRREAVEAAARLKTDADGKRIIVRFNLSQRIEHQLLIVSFTMLALTGLPQRFANTGIGGFTLQLLGGIETARQMHHLFAALFILEGLYHVGIFIYGVVANGRVGSMWPTLDDAQHLIQMLRLNLGLSNERPRLGRYSFEEKMEYWALVWGGVVMIATGFIQWFPILVTRWLPGAAIPIARAFHGWEAILAALAILTWHAYHAVLKHFNKSIFTGYMTEEEMREEHPAELAYIEHAVALLQHHETRRTRVAPTTLETPTPAQALSPEPLPDEVMAGTSPMSGGEA
jgi:formate dehydrogenase gamma subunit